MAKRSVKVEERVHACSVPGCTGRLEWGQRPDGSAAQWCRACERRIPQLAALHGVRRLHPTRRKPRVARWYLEALPTRKEEAVTAAEWAILLGVPVARIRVFACEVRHWPQVGRVVPPTRQNIRYWRREEVASA